MEGKGKGKLSDFCNMANSRKLIIVGRNTKFEK